MSTTADRFRLDGRVALVTGASRGLGRAMALALAEAGARVAICGRRKNWLDEARAGFGERGFECLAVECDVSEEGDVAALASRVLTVYGRIDILVNNAGVAWAARAEEMPLEKWRAVMETNVTGTFLVSREVGRHMMARGGGAIVNIASIAGLVGTGPGVLDAVGYSASKGAVIAFTRDLAVKWAPRNIRVNAIAPGYFRTRLSQASIDRNEESLNRLVPLGRIGREDELKGAVVYLASDASSYVTGHVLVVDGGLTVQ
ncbi:MAG: glucose 1-dehydrogenase [Actinobacteria bacterium]|nr:glucose 1-dehydrogenase [Actinomycetota bacterium]